MLTLADSYNFGEDYDYGVSLKKAVRMVLGRELGDQVRRDLVVLQDRGLDRMDRRRKVLRETYSQFDHPAAAEILSWLDGHWTVFDGSAQTQ
jgi:hypothetical protein